LNSLLDLLIESSVRVMKVEGGNIIIEPCHKRICTREIYSVSNNSMGYEGLAQIVSIPSFRGRHCTLKEICKR